MTTPTSGTAGGALRPIWLSRRPAPDPIEPLLLELLAPNLPDAGLRRALLEELTWPAKTADVVLDYFGLRGVGVDSHGEVELLLVSPVPGRSAWRDALLVPGGDCPIGVMIATRDRGAIGIVHEAFASLDEAGKGLVRRHAALASRGVAHEQIIAAPGNDVPETVAAARRQIQGVVDPSILLSPDGAIRVQLGSLSETTRNLLREGLQGEHVFILPTVVFEGRTNYADMEFVVYLNFFVQHGRPTRIVGSARQREVLERLLRLVTFGLFDPGRPEPATFEELRETYGVPDPTTYAFFRTAYETYSVRAGQGPTAPVLGFEAYVAFTELGPGETLVPVHPVDPDGRRRFLGEVGVTPGVDGGFDVRISQRDGRSVAKRMQLIRRRSPVAQVPAELAHVLRFGTDRPRFGVTPLGTSHGFDPTGDVTSFVIWINGRGVLVDPSPEALLYLEQIGVAPLDIPYVILTHVHADHDGGLIEKLLSGHRATVIASDVVFRCLAEKVELVTGHHVAREDLALHVPANPGEPIALEIGGEAVTLETRWNLHPIPTNGFRMTVGGKTFGYAGDTQYDPDLVSDLYVRGQLTRRQRDDLLHFFWDAAGTPSVDLLYHEAGIPPIHTDKATLAALPEAVRARTFLVHIADQDVPVGFSPPKPPLFATQVLLPSSAPARHRILLEDLRLVSYLYDVPAATLEALLAGAAVREYAKEEPIVHQGPVGKGEPLNFYVIVDGAADVRDGRRIVATLGKGDSLGEWGISHQRGYRLADVIATRACQCVEFTEAQYRWLVGRHPMIQERIGKIRSLLPRLQVAQARARRRSEADPSVRMSIVSTMTVSQLSSFTLFSNVAVFKEGQAIVLEGAEADGFYVLLSGHLAATTGGRVIGEMSEGDIFGEIGLLEGGRRGATVGVVSADAEVLFMSAQNFRNLLQAVPAFALEIRETAGIRRDQDQTR